MVIHQASVTGEGTLCRWRWRHHTKNKPRMTKDRMHVTCKVCLNKREKMERGRGL